MHSFFIELTFERSESQHVFHDCLLLLLMAFTETIIIAFLKKSSTGTRTLHAQLLHFPQEIIPILDHVAHDCLCAWAPQGPEEVALRLRGKHMNWHLVVSLHYLLI